MNRLVHQLGAKVAERLRPKPVPFSSDAIQFTSRAGYRIFARVLTPHIIAPIPSIVLCPDGPEDHDSFFNGIAPIQAEELAGMGIAVLCHDPSGRGQSWGPEDWGGIEHQDNVVQSVQWLRECAPFKTSSVGILSISLGLSSAIGAAKMLAESGEPVSWVIDWNGACDQRSITRGETHLAPAMGHSGEDLSYWYPREAFRHVHQIAAGYWRLQVQPDPTTNQDLTHASQTMLNAAHSGNLPWFRLNDHPVGRIPKRAVWIGPDSAQANRALRRAVGRAINRD